MKRCNNVTNPLHRVFFSYNVKFCDEAARCLSNLFPLFDLNIGHLGGSRNKELSQFKLKNIVVNRDSYARISGSLSFIPG